MAATSRTYVRNRPSIDHATVNARQCLVPCINGTQPGTPTVNGGSTYRSIANEVTDNDWVMRAPQKRWDTDTRGTGSGDATSARPALDRLGEAMRVDGWVAEEPELHLLPHLEGAAETIGAEIQGTDVVDGAFEIEIGRAGRSGAEMRVVTMALVSTIAEASTHVRQ